MSRSSVALTSLCLLALIAGGCSFDADGFGFPGGGGDGDGPGGDNPWPGGDNPVDDGERECFYGTDDPDTPAAVIEHTLTVIDGVDAVQVELVLDPRFVDNTYGATSIGWAQRKKGMHSFKDLVGSDHAELLMTDGDGALAVDVALDYLTADDGAPSGYRSLGVTGGDGKVITGDPADVVAATSSLDRNLNERGYAAYTVDSPQTDASYTPNPAAPDWDYRVVYEVWVDVAAFGPAGFGAPTIETIHASPAKGGDNTIVVDPRPCPEDWCTEPFGCTPEPDCNDPDGCDPGTGDPGGCADDIDCPTGEFCGEQGTCLPIIG